MNCPAPHSVQISSSSEFFSLNFPARQLLQAVFPFPSGFLPVAHVGHRVVRLTSFDAVPIAQSSQSSRLVLSDRPCLPCGEIRIRTKKGKERGEEKTNTKKLISTFDCSQNKLHFKKKKNSYRNTWKAIWLSRLRLVESSKTILTGKKSTSKFAVLTGDAGHARRVDSFLSNGTSLTELST